MRKLTFLLCAVSLLPFVGRAQVPQIGKDWRSFFPPAKDQLFRGSCAMFASIAAMEFHGGVPKLSEAYAYSILKANDLDFDGATLSRMKQFLESEPMVASRFADEKLPYESFGVFSFDEGKSNEVAVARAFNRSKAKQAELLSSQAIYKARNIRIFKSNEMSASWIRERLDKYGPFVVGMSMNSSHWSAATKGVIRNPSPNVKDDGGHAVVIVDYTKDNYLVFRNSWGVRWGDQGYGYMPMDYALSRIGEAMTIGYVDTLVTDRNKNEQFDIRGNAWKNDDGTYRVFFSLILLGGWVPGGGITKVTYSVFGPNDDTGDRRVRPLAVTSGNDSHIGFGAEVKSVRYHSLQVCVDIEHRDRGFSGGCRPLPEVLTWSPDPVYSAPNRVQ